MRQRRLSVFMVATVAAVGMARLGAPPAHATSLARQFSSFVTQARLFPGVTAPDTLTPVIVRLGAQATDFPVPPTTPGYVFVYNPVQGIFERSSGSLGPVFLERVETVWQNHASIGMSYLYGNVNQFDGNDVAQGASAPIGAVITDPGTGDQLVSGVLLDRFDLPTHKLNFAATYGITDDWDIGVLLPLVVTSLNVEGRVFLDNRTTGQSAEEAAAPVNGSSVGVGDLLLRTKYRFGYLFDWGFAGGLTLRFPTGDEDDFHGLGDWTVQPALIISRTFGVQDVHANLGMEFNGDDSTRTRARYGIGATLMWPTIDWIAFLLDFVGTSGLDDEQIRVTATDTPQAQVDGFVLPQFGGATQQRQGNTIVIDYTLPRTDQFYAAVGFKFAIWGNALGYMNAVVPLTRQGLQANVISAAGVEYSF
jgi:hypothetical protein